MAIIQEISEFLQKGRAKNVKTLVQQALDEGMDPKVILNEGLLDGMMVVGSKFKKNEIFVPEVLVAARAMNAGLTILKPKLVEVGNEPIGRVVIGTVEGDLHDIGKNLVGMMLQGAGFEVIDVGVWEQSLAVEDEEFVNTVGQNLLFHLSLDTRARNYGVEVNTQFIGQFAALCQ